MRTLRRLSTTLFLLCLTGMTSAQDVIVRKDQSTIMSKVLEITSTEIKYKKWNNQDGPTYSINRSEVVSINYQNGEMETVSNHSDSANDLKPQLQNHAGGFMDRTYTGLKLDGKALSDEEVRSLVGEQSYQIYLKGKRDYSISGACFCTSILAALGSGVMFALNKRGPAILFTVIDAASWIGWVCIDGDDEMKQVAAEYNRKHGNYYSYSISPSLMKCEMPQSSNNNCFGLTVSVNF